MNALLETDKSEETNCCQWLWQKKAGEWICTWSRDDAFSDWQPFGNSLKELMGHTETGDSPKDIYPDNKFEVLTESDLFILLL